ncbi:putative ATP-dependent RNA helicase TDRD12 [Stegastes partitus]|uniref:RNA helicase n=1 Tax=Stegastes partitus TaxID=144197 RepID=A0A9Y4NSZ6_9TELE|nr:PREDICTED: putative ATP-dependent RNA helicase TDRD12 [Stegastes partitus]
MQKISILKVDNPSCLWGRVVWGSGADTDTADQYNSMLTQMNLFYHDVTQDLHKLKPTSLVKGQVCVVYWTAIRSWCRAVVESIYMDSISCQARCLLVDHGQRLVIPSDQIRLAVPNFLQLPFWVRKFHLAGIKPTTLRVSVYEEKAELIQSSRWDSSATLYLHNLLQASTQTEAVLLESESDSTSMELYLTVSNIKICVNDDLVAKRFAYYSRDSADSGGLDEGDRLPVMLSSSILTQTISTASNKLITQSQPPLVASQSLAGAGAGDWLTASSLPKSQQHDLMTSKGDHQVKITEQELSPSIQSSNGSDAAAATESDPSEDTDSSLASALAKNLNLFSSLSRSLDSEPGEAEETWRSEEDRACSRLLEWLNPEPLNRDPDTTKDVVPLDDPRSSGILVHCALPVEPCSSPGDAPITDALRLVLRRKQYNTLSAADCYSWPAVARGCNTVIVSHNADQPLSYLTPLLTHILLNSIFTSFTSSSGPIAVLLCPGWEKVQVVYDLLEECNVAHSLHPISMLLGVGKDEAKAVKIPKNCLLLVTTPFTLVRLLSCHSFLFLRLYHLVLDEADQLFTLAPDQITLMTLESSKISVLLGTLDFNPDVGQKTLIVANSVQEVEDVFKAVSNKSAFCLKTHEGLTHQFDFAIQQWRKDVGPGSHVILVTTNDCVKCLGIRDATCVVHYGFPTSPKLFGSRLFCMAENFRNLSEQGQIECCPHVAQSVLLISDRNARHVVGILRYLGRTNALLPPELLSFAQGIQEAREDQKMNSPLCSYVKSFGVCRDSSVCPDRHRFISQLDQSELPASGVIEVVPLYIKTASVFYGRIVKKEDRRFDIMSSEMASYYADKKPGAKELLEGGLYAVQEEEVFHRVKILSLPDRDDCLFFSVCAEFIDVGKEEEVRSHQILHLPEQFQSLPGQAVEIIICRVKPVDAENNWHPKVTRAISQKIRGLQHRGRAVLSLGNTVFVDPMVRVTQVPGMKTLINEYSIQSEIQNTGMGIGNPEHLDLLRALCQEAGFCKEAKHTSRQGDGLPSLETRVKTEENIMAEAFRVAEVKKLAAQELPHFKPCVPEGADQSNRQQVISPDGADCDDLTKSFHPQVRWYQTSDCVILTVKLMNPDNQRCDFYPDRVIYSGRVNGRSYRVDMELHQNIAADCCCLKMNSNEPVLILVKQQQGYWERLVRNKNMFVSYDMEHVDNDDEGDDGDKTPNGLFVENTGEDNWYVISESSSDSD